MQSWSVKTLEVVVNICGKKKKTADFQKNLVRFAVEVLCIISCYLDLSFFFRQLKTGNK